MSKAKAAANEVDVHVGSRVRIRRQLIKMTQATLGRGLGLTFQQVQKYETGTNRMGASRLQQASQILQCPSLGSSRTLPLPTVCLPRGRRPTP